VCGRENPLKEGKNMVEKTNSSSSLVEVIDRILDKGVVVDAWVRVSLVGIEILAIEARVVIASVETFLKYAEAVGLTEHAEIAA
jgi:gas vesicle structural protein